MGGGATARRLERVALGFFLLIHSPLFHPELERTPSKLERCYHVEKQSPRIEAAVRRALFRGPKGPRFHRRPTASIPRSAQAPTTERTWRVRGARPGKPGAANSASPSNLRAGELPHSTGPSSSHTTLKAHASTGLFCGLNNDWRKRAGAATRKSTHPSLRRSGQADVQVRIFFARELAYFFCSNRGLQDPPSGSLNGP